MTESPDSPASSDAAAGDAPAADAAADDAAADAREPERPEPEWVRRRRLAAVFGDVLPDETSDDASRGRGGKGDDWYRDQVPPHHG